ncbi:alpha-pore-forming tripartite toxin MakABE regulator [Pectobacterium versatile]|jgi:hypothetical protein|uniref:Inclusion body protein n=1 Tax=Pectobacterium versatile TaxID=2488639 RepID=A0AAW3RKM2_9GAMM|nr:MULTISPECIES: hypothetical protein [Pectobacterium]ASN86886.1 Hypothetical protein SCC1_3484 [Pectobacterium versatile]MBA0157937.1 hypothetical protein [Pectobacterium versatile]MBA0162909.1 hypothetical protein [Pectobacterium versatile]MBN3058487.1 hypothetical protein [Pectobacterium versatile]MBQ4763375.1 hypothetical protein [Pectobacterium versatile]
MNEIDVLIVVDAENALASNNLGSNVYLIDTNKYMGSGNEGQEELKTSCHDGQVINWHVTGVSLSSDVSILSFTGQMVNDKVCVPVAVNSINGTYWQGRVEAQGTTGGQQYSVVLELDGRSMTFDPFIEIS